MIDFEYCERIGRRVIKIIESRLNSHRVRRVRVVVYCDGHIDLIDCETGNTIHTVRVVPECVTIIANALIAKFSGKEKSITT